MGLDGLGTPDQRRSPETPPRESNAANTPPHSGTFLHAGTGLFPFSPSNILPHMPGQYGLSVRRMLIATAVFAVSLAAMKLVPNLGVGAAVVPMWCAAVGTLVDGWRGALRGIILSMIYPIYCAILLSIAFGIFWLYALMHRLIGGEQILW